MTDTTPLSKPLGQRIAFWLALILVVVGMVNTLPEIPGLQDLARDLTGRPFFRVSNFPPEYFYPPVFLLMMLIVALDSSVYRAWREERPNIAWVGFLLDAGLI
ncbi:MAG: C4-dicarboxylate ABC transporter, partial [Pseudomonadota bacterium]|nr:C4-dicarboxylate ABC transporter [Pseudomonadota bacterium]